MPTLTVLAGPNGAGKTIFSTFLFEASFLNKIPYNPDVILDKTKALLESVSWDQIHQEEPRLQHLFFIEAWEEAVRNNQDFSFEVNLRKGQLENINIFEI